MSRLQQLFVRRATLKSLRIILAIILFSSLAGAGGVRDGISSASAAAQRTRTDPELFGMVIRDPFYEYNTDPVNFHEASNRTALERQAIELQTAGVRWIRMEFFADYDGTVAPGDINWSKYDWFINEDGTECEVHEAYLSGEGLIEHNAHVMDARAILFEKYAYDHRMTAFGEVSQELRELVLKHAGGIAVYAFLQGLETAAAV